MKPFWINLLKRTAFYVLVVAALWAALAYVDWRELARAHITNYFAANGLKIADMRVETLLPTGVEFSNVQVAEPSPFTVGFVRLNVLARTLEAKDIIIPELWGPEPGTFNAMLKFGFRGGAMVMDGTVNGSPNDVAATFTLFPNREKPEALRVHVQEASMRWNGGLLRAQNADFYPNQNTATPVTVQLENIPLDVVLKQMLHPQAFATGTFSGTLPLVYRAGNIRIAGANINTVQAGTLRVPPGIVPQTGQEMMLLADVLSNFDYSILQIATGSVDADGKTPLMLRMEGHNPAHGTQPIKLNVNLGGDVLPFINSALQFSSNPSGMIRHENYQ